MNRSTLLWIASLGVCLAGISVIRATNSDVAVLRTKDAQYGDRYSTLWVIEDGRWLWVRAATPDRHWLEDIRPEARVRLTRHGSTRVYEASIQHDEQSREHVDRLMREKYGLADIVRELVLGTDTLPVQLVPID